MSHGLVPTDLRETMSARTRRRLASDETLRAALRQGTENLALHRTDSAQARADARQRAGVRLALRESARLASKSRSEGVRAKNDQLARERGYTDIVDALQRTVHLTAPEIAGLLGVSPAQARKLRSRYAIRSEGRTHQAAERAREREGEAALRPLGVEPGVLPGDGQT